VTEIVAIDIGGTHARFALAEIDGGRVKALAESCTLKTSEHASLETAWEAFRAGIGRPLPRAIAIAIAAPVQGEVIKMTNNSWVIQPALIPERLDVDEFQLVNDFGAVAHAVAQLGDQHFTHLCGDDARMSAQEVVTVVGPGTGLGVAQLLRHDGSYRVNETEGGHTDFAPLDEIEDAILEHLRVRFRRVSVERIVSGMGLLNIYEALSVIERRPAQITDERTLWASALSREDSLAVAALDRFCLALGAVAGDMALAHGSQAVVIGGGLGLRLRDHLPGSSFHSRFIAKGRFERQMDKVPVTLITHPQAGLYGAAAAFAYRKEVAVGADGSRREKAAQLAK
jgi:glucokinase